MIPSLPNPLPRSRRALVAAALLALSVAAAGTAYAASLNVTSSKLTGWSSATSVGCTAPGTVTASANADTYVDEASAGSNFGSNASMRVRSNLRVVLVGGNARTLVRFTLPATPDLCTVTDATLMLYASSAASGRTLEAVRASASWVEGSVNWNTKPGATGTAVTAASGTGYRSWTVTAHVLSMYAGPNNGFLVRDETENAVLSYEQVFSSRDAANVPVLEITFG